MSAIYIISKNGKSLMPTTRYGHVRHLLKEGKAEIYSRNPFTGKLLYDSKEFTQPIEIGVDTGYIHIGVSVKSEKREYFSGQFDCLKDEKLRHDDCRKYRRTRRNRLRYRKPRWNNRISTKPEGWIAPSLEHKAENHIRIIENICKVAPIVRVTLEVGEFDTALLKAMQTGEKIPEGIEYQHGPLYFADSLRKAVFQRDNYTCRVCKKSPLRDSNVILKTHHALYWKGRHANTLQELMTVCDKCHTSANHKEGGKLYGLEPKVPRLEGATYMNIVRWYIVNTLKSSLPNIEIRITYGAITSRTRKDLGIEKSHADDAYCIGNFYPSIRAKTEHFTKRRRNNRCLERFYDAKIYDSRDGSIRSGSQLSCGRTNRKIPRNSENNLRKFRGNVKSKGKRAIRKQRYSIQAGDIILFKGKKYNCHGCMGGGESVLLANAKESPTGKAITVSSKKALILKHINGWV